MNRLTVSLLLSLVMATMVFAGCGGPGSYGSVSAFGKPLINYSSDSITIKNNMEGRVIQNIPGYPGRFLPTGAEITLDTGYYGERGATVPITVDVHDAVTGAYLGVAVTEIYVSGQYQNNYRQHQHFDWIVESYRSVVSADKKRR